MNNHCRISKVRFRDGRTLSILPTREVSDLAKRMTRLIERAKGSEGFLFIAWDEEAGYWYDYHLGKMNMITPGLLPSWVHDILLREITTQGIVWEPGDGDGA